MPLPININELIHGSTVEWERIEFKEGWNPEIILHTICAFANDINNWGGGYLIIGIAESNGRAVLPPKGLDINELDKIQQELHQLCHKITPTYFPIVEPYQIDGRYFLVVWCTGGEARPYKANKTLSNNSDKAYYVRRMSSTAKANEREEQQLLQLTAKIPFDDRVNHHANISDLSLAEIRMFLQDIKSDLFQSAGTMPFNDLVVSMQIARGAIEDIRPVNAGLLFFCEKPERFFPYSWIEINIYHDDVGDSFSEKVFKGPIHQQLREALSYIKNSVIEEYVEKVDGQAESNRFYNYPYLAIEEALANAVYHKNYEIREPIEVNIRLDCIEILSHAGPMPPLTKDDLKKERIIARKYLNRRVGDFLKELHLTEGKGTGIPKIRREMRNNGSKEPIFETDDERSYFLTILLGRTGTKIKGPVDVQVHTESIKKIELNEFSINILLELNIRVQSSKDIAEKLNIETKHGAMKRALKILRELDLIEYTIPDKPNSSKQEYRLTSKGSNFVLKQLGGNR
jgi:ATP-dependent DNA helicase RecG